jgi:Family of unknown function (DUF6460)
MDYAAKRRISAGFFRDEGSMLNRLTRTLVKVVVASLIVGTILTHFGITAGQLMTAAGLSSDQVTEFARTSMAWALPNLMLGAVVIVPLWFLIYLFRPPGESRD